jgi:alpha-galactosidase
LVNEELRERRRSSATSALADWITNSELYDQSLDRIFQAAGDLTEEFGLYDF